MEAGPFLRPKRQNPRREFWEPRWEDLTPAAERRIHRVIDGLIEHASSMFAGDRRKCLAQVREWLINEPSDSSLAADLDVLDRWSLVQMGIGEFLEESLTVTLSDLRGALEDWASVVIQEASKAWLSEALERLESFLENPALHFYERWPGHRKPWPRIEEERSLGLGIEWFRCVTADGKAVEIWHYSRDQFNLYFRRAMEYSAGSSG